MRTFGFRLFYDYENITIIIIFNTKFGVTILPLPFYFLCIRNYGF